MELQNFFFFIENADSEHSLWSNRLDNSEHFHGTSHFVESAGHNPQSSETSDIISLMKELINQMKNSEISNQNLAETTQNFVSQIKSSEETNQKTNTLLASSITAQNSLIDSIRDLINKKFN